MFITDPSGYDGSRDPAAGYVESGVKSDLGSWPPSCASIYLLVSGKIRGEAVPALRKAKVASGCLLVSLSLAFGTAYSQQAENRGSDGIPDLQGVYSIATVTMLERGEQFGGELVISAEQAAAVGETGASYLDDLVSNVGGAEAQVGGYNTFWMDPGERMAVIDGGIRSSIIVEPKDGRLPWAEGALRRIFGSRPSAGSFDGQEVPPLG